MNSHTKKSQLVAIVGGSGAGKTWLSGRLLQLFGTKKACLISLDDFYHDRSHLPLSRRERVNFDHPRAIDWALLEKVLLDCGRGRPTRLPIYDFTTHSRLTRKSDFKPKQVVLVEGLWLLRRAPIRRLFDFRVFIDCPESVRFERRLNRDQSERGRSLESVQNQFWKKVAPMHERFVAPQKKWADLLLKPHAEPGAVKELAMHIAGGASFNQAGRELKAGKKI